MAGSRPIEDARWLCSTVICAWLARAPWFAEDLATIEDELRGARASVCELTISPAFSPGDRGFAVEVGAAVADGAAFVAAGALAPAAGWGAKAVPLFAESSPLQWGQGPDFLAEGLLQWGQYIMVALSPLFSIKGNPQFVALPKQTKKFALRYIVTIMRLVLEFRLAPFVAIG